MPLGRLVAKALDPVTRKRGFASARLLTDWESVVGRDIAAMARPEKLAFPRGRKDQTRPGQAGSSHAGSGGGGTLHLSCASGDALELRHMGDVIRERVNAFLGWAAVADIRLQAGRAPARTAPRQVEAAPAASEPADGRLGAALARLDRAVKR